MENEHLPCKAVHPLVTLNFLAPVDSSDLRTPTCCVRTSYKSCAVKQADAMAQPAPLQMTSPSEENKTYTFFYQAINGSPTSQRTTNRFIG
jgi:hypothetical protein